MNWASIPFSPGRGIRIQCMMRSRLPCEGLCSWAHTAISYSWEHNKDFALVNNEHSSPEACSPARSRGVQDHPVRKRNGPHILLGLAYFANIHSDALSNSRKLQGPLCSPWGHGDGDYSSFFRGSREDTFSGDQVSILAAYQVFLLLFLLLLIFSGLYSLMLVIKRSEISQSDI